MILFSNENKTEEKNNKLHFNISPKEKEYLNSKDEEKLKGTKVYEELLKSLKQK